MHKIDILIPQYSETDSVIKPLLDSIAIQQAVDMSSIGVIIRNDGSDTRLSDAFLSSYPFDVDYAVCPHKGVSATRNACLDASDAELVIFCDADDMFYSPTALWFIANQYDHQPFDAMVSVFIEQTKDPMTGATAFIERGRAEQGGVDSTFVHGKAFRRRYLTDNGIRFGDALTIHEDSYFNILAQSLTDRAIYCPFPWYMWRWRDESVCRHDPKYILKTYNNMLESNSALIREFIRRGKPELASRFATMMMFDAYFTMNKREWIDQENKAFRDATERRFNDYVSEFESVASSLSEAERQQILTGLRTRFSMEGMGFESITYPEWIKHIKALA